MIGLSQPGSWPDPHAVGDLGDDRAADRAMRADVLPGRQRRAGRRRRAGLGLADCAERQRAERGKAAGGEARTAQEAATIETTACLDWESRNKDAAVSFALCPLDQHDGLPHFAG